MSEKVILVRYPKCEQRYEFEIPAGLKTGIDRYNYIEEQLKHISWNPPEIIESEEELESRGYYYKTEETNADV